MSNNNHTLLCKRAAAISALALIIPLSTAQAAPFKIYSPIVEKGEIALEYQGFRDIDHRKAIDHSQTHKAALEYGVTDFWKTEIEVEFEKEGRGSLKDNAIEFENVFQFTPQGKYWADLGLFAEYEIATRKGNPDEIKIGPLIQKEFGPRLSATANAFFTREVGGNAASGTTFSYGARVKYNINQYLEPAIEAFGEPGNFKGGLPAFKKQEHWIGPALYGAVKMGQGQALKALKYRAAALFGATKPSSDSRLVLELEYEF